jgi:hypothetical protein
MNIKLDEQNHYTGSYATIGTVDGGIDIDTLPPDMSKAEFYIYDYHDVTSLIPHAKTQDVTSTDVISGEEITTTELVLDIDGNTVYEDISTTTSVLEWFLDDVKYQESLITDIENLKLAKIGELSKVCETTIINGLDIQTTVGLEHFSLKITDQLDMSNQYSTILAGATAVPYHADNTICRMFSAEEIGNVIASSVDFVTYNRTYFNYIKEVVKRCTTEAEIVTIVWGTSLPIDLDNKFIGISGKSTIAE